MIEIYIETSELKLTAKYNPTSPNDTSSFMRCIEIAIKESSEQTILLRDKH